MIMIQRVQSIYLLLVTVLMSFVLIRPYAALDLTDGQTLTFRSYKIEYNAGSEQRSTYKSTIPLVFLAVVTALISFGNIFLYHRRIWQLRVCLINTVLIVVLLATMYLYYIRAKSSLDVAMHAFRLPAIYPLLCVFLSLLAYRNIHSDELLVNSYNRIR